MSVVAACVMLSGCSDALDGGGVTDGSGMVTINLRNSSATRSDASDNSETLIGNVVVALYPDSYGEEEPAVALQKFDGLDVHDVAKVQMKLTDEMVDKLFNGVSGVGCKLYAVANVGDMSKISDNATISELKGTVAASSFDTRKVQESFVMAGPGTVKYVITGGKGAATGTGDLVRAAAKVRLNVKLPESVTDDNGDVWYPEVREGSGMRVMLTNGVKSSVVSPATDLQPGDDDYYSMTMRQTDVVRTLSDRGAGEYRYQMDVPLYTYPNRWTETPEERHKTMMTLVVPWRKAGEQTWSTYFYQVPVTDLTQISSNYSYTVNLNVGMLGSLVPETPEELDELSYQIVDWSSERIDVNITDSRYLVVSPKNFEVQSQNDIEIQIYSSHPIELEDITLKYNRYAFVNENGYTDTGKVVTFTVSKEQIDLSNEKSSGSKFCTYRVEKDANGQYSLFISHPLVVWDPYDSNDNQVSLTGYKNANDETVAAVQRQISYYKKSDPIVNAYSPYTIDVSVRHVDRHEYKENLTVVQYPGMYVEADRNPGGSYQASSYGNPTNYGYAYVNPTWHEAGWISKAYWENSTTLGGLLEITSSSSNKNPNMYVIAVSTLFNIEDSYIIGDPRENYYSNDLSGDVSMEESTKDDLNEASWSVDASALYKENGSSAKRKLKYYYRTNESDAYKWMVAPKFRVASSYAEMSKVSRQNCRRRCASYQEQGYPAGRWRMPTYGEMKFIVWLAKTGKIPPLFNTGVYMTAQGAYTVNDDGSLEKNPSTSGWVRAVYDEWYWEAQDNYVLQPNSSGGYDFTWGDVPRNATRSAELINMYKSRIVK